MIDLPTKPKLDEINFVADWVELCVLGSKGNRVSQAEIADLLHDSGLMSVTVSEVFASDADDEELAEDADDVDDAISTRVEDVFAVIADRRKRLGVRYPIEVDDGVAMLSPNEDGEYPLSFAAMTILANLVAYPVELEVSKVDEISFRQLFEKIVEASAQGLFRGTTVRFGWPREPNWPTAIDERVEHLAELMRLRVERLEGKTEPLDKDKTLDVVSRLSFGDDSSGSVIFMTQCAVGRNWRDKAGEPNLADWLDVLRWEACLVRSVAFPWWFSDPTDYARQHRHFSSAVVLDRPRLLSGDPDRFLAEPIIALLERWIEDQLAALPRPDL